MQIVQLEGIYQPFILNCLYTDSGVFFDLFLCAQVLAREMLSPWIVYQNVSALIIYYSVLS